MRNLTTHFNYTGAVLKLPLTITNIRKICERFPERQVAAARSSLLGRGAIRGHLATEAGTQRHLTFLNKAVLEKTSDGNKVLRKRTVLLFRSLGTGRAPRLI